MSEEQDHNVLNEPIHGIYIPSALFLVGIGIIVFMSGETKYLTGIPILLALLGFRFYSAYSRRKSVYPNAWTALELEDQILISKNSAIYRFKLKTSLETLKIPVGHHLAVKIPIEGKNEIRYYTPITQRYDTGHFDIIVKSYTNGKVSKYFASLKPGQLVEFQGPVGRFNYATNSSKAIGMIAGGSGITPMLQVLSQIVTTPEDTTKVSLIYANETENDILLKDELDEMANKYPNFEVHYVLRTPPPGWTGDTGYVTKDQMQKYLPGPSDENRLLICGPLAMINMLLNYSEELGWPRGIVKSKPDDQVFVF